MDRLTLNLATWSHHPSSVIIFDLRHLKEIGVTPTDPRTDGVIYDPASKHACTFNGKNPGVHNATVIDAASCKRIGTMALPGVPESAAVDGSGRVYVNIASASELAEIDTKTLKVLAVWPLGP